MREKGLNVFLHSDASHVEKDWGTGTFHRDGSKERGVNPSGPMTQVLKAALCQFANDGFTGHHHAFRGRVKVPQNRRADWHGQTRSGLHVLWKSCVIGRGKLQSVTKCNGTCRPSQGALCRNMQGIRIEGLDLFREASSRKQGKPDFRIGGAGYGLVALWREKAHHMALPLQLRPSGLKGSYDPIDLRAPRIRNDQHPLHAGSSAVVATGRSAGIPDR